MSVCAALHPPAGTFSPYSDGVKGDGISLAARTATVTIGGIIGGGVLSPVTIRGEMPGSAMRVSANLRYLVE
ncbi:hypothetical protein X763_28745 [Mesorhizobium sp. LSHC432A00]|nr:hypothetical protein X763_28745 [Mesorhizobium sp. LSHC432A00]ESY26592.1 hypothetical protein X749_26775 [Mesorhizobium sp. LNJC391B00]